MSFPEPGAPAPVPEGYPGQSGASLYPDGSTAMRPGPQPGGAAPPSWQHLQQHQQHQAPPPGGYAPPPGHGSGGYWPQQAHQPSPAPGYPPYGYARPPPQPPHSAHPHPPAGYGAPPLPYHYGYPPPGEYAPPPAHAPPPGQVPPYGHMPPTSQGPSHQPQLANSGPLPLLHNSYATNPQQPQTSCAPGSVHSSSSALPTLPAGYVSGTSPYVPGTTPGYGPNGQLPPSAPPLNLAYGSSGQIPAIPLSNVKPNHSGAIGIPIVHGTGTETQNGIVANSVVADENGLPVVPGDMVLAGATTLKVEEKVLGRDSFYVNDMSGSLRYKIDGRISLNERKTLKDAKGTPLLKMKEARFKLKDKLTISNTEGTPVFTLQQTNAIQLFAKKVHGYLGAKTSGTPALIITGNHNNTNFKAMDSQGRQVATITRKKFSLKNMLTDQDSYELTVIKGSPALLCMIVVALDEIFED